MIIFLDTSSLFKLYHKEVGSEELSALFRNNKIDIIYLSEITKLEFDSTVWKKFRKNEISREVVKIIISNFEKDWHRYKFIEDNPELKLRAKKLISKYGADGLRTLDSIQLASALAVKSSTNSYLTSDNLLLNLFRNEHLPVLF